MPKATPLIVLLGGAILAAQPLRPATPTDPIGLIVDALKTHSIVAFSDAHGHRELDEFEWAVVRDPRIRQLIDDIVIENGNARFQSAVDAYINGDAVPYELLHHAWHDTTQVQTIGPLDGSIPVIYRLVRELNASAKPPFRRMRIVLGDPPIDWASVRTAEDHRRWIEQRDIHGAEVVKREVLAKRRRALVVYGEGHLQRRNQGANYTTEGLAATVGSGIEAAAPGQLFTLWWMTDRMAPPQETSSWPAPSAALVRGTTLGALDFSAFEEIGFRAQVTGTQITPLPRDEWKTLRMEEQFDAVLKLPRIPSVPAAAGNPADACADKEWVTEWIRRLTLPGGPPGGGPNAGTAQRLREACKL
jgi:hypothetical protein